MKRFALILALCLAAPVVLAQDAGAEVSVIMDAGVAAAGAPAVEAAPVVSPADILANPLTSFKAFYIAAKSGYWGLACALLLFAVVALLRTFGKKIHDLIPDTNPIDKPFWFLFDTKIGGWILNWLTAVAGVLGSAYMAGMPVDGAAWKTAVLCSTGGTALIELKDDIMEWWVARKAKKAAEAAAKDAVAAGAAALAAVPAAAKPEDNVITKP
jgi:hypothetical protein